MTHGAGRRLQDRVAVVGVGSTPHLRDSGATGRTLALRAAREAIRDAGLTAADIDGVVGSQTVHAREIVTGLGLPEVHWWANTHVPFTYQLIEAAHAVYSGACEIALAYHAPTRLAGTSRSAAADPLRARQGLGANRPAHTPDSVGGAVGYAAWAARYAAEFGLKREHLGLIAINARSNAARNPRSALRDPLTMAGYLQSSMVRDPLCVLDMDYPVDAADALVITTAERAADLAKPPVLIHALTGGMTGLADEEQLAGLDQSGQQVVMRRLWKRSDVGLSDVDVVFPYDGFSFLALRWLEVMGYCGDGEGGAFLDQHWDSAGQRVLIDGRVPLNPHGGSLASGGTQGAGHLHEAVLQLRGEAEQRQVPDARVALVTPGGLFHNATGVILRN